MTPRPFCYAVAQINVEESLRKLDFLDDEAMSAIRALQPPPKSLVFLHAVRHRTTATG